MAPNKWKTRQDTCLDTTKKEYFDQVVSLSQGIINEHFQKLYDMNKKMHKIFFDPPTSDYSTVEATLLAPRLVLNVDSSTNTNEVYYILRIEKGKITNRKWDDISLDGWELAAKCSLKEMTIRGIHAGATEAEKAEILKTRDKQLADVNRHYLAPADYSVERLFASLATVPWSRLDEFSTCGVNANGSRKTYPEWAEENPLVKTHLTTALEQWAEIQQRNGYTTLGVKFKLPDRPKSDASFIPTGLITQVYRYCTEEQPNGKTGYTGTSAFNCLSYCENVGDRALPSAPQLGWSGNFAMPEDEHGRSINGTFAIRHNVIMNKFFLPRLQGLCLGGQLQVHKPTHKVEPDDTLSIYPGYSLGCDPEGTPEDKRAKATDSQFTFDLGTEKDGVIEFRWKQSQSRQSNLDSPIEHHYSRGFLFFKDNYSTYLTYDIKADSDVCVTVNPGTPTFKIKGKTIYDFDVKWTRDRDRKDVKSYKTYILTLSWTFNVRLSVTDDGKLTAIFENCDNNTPSIECDTSNRKVHNVDGKTEVALEKFLRKNLVAAISNAIQNVTKVLEVTGKFTYPGSGDLLFSWPEFNRQADLLANITYAPLGDKQIVVPSVDGVKFTPLPTPTPKTRTPKENPDPTAGQAPLKLTWSHDLHYDPKTERLTMTITANNYTSHDIGFGWLGIDLMVNDEEQAVFNGTAFKEQKVKGFFQKAWDFLKHLLNPDFHEDQQPQQRPTTPVGGKSPSGDEGKPHRHIEDDIYTLSASKDVHDPLKISIDYPPPENTLTCAVTAASSVEQKVAAVFVLPPNAAVSIIISGQSSPGKYSYMIHESWKDPEDGSGLGRAKEFKEIVY